MDKNMKVAVYFRTATTPIEQKVWLYASSKHSEQTELRDLNVEAMKHTPLLRASGLHEEFHLLADFGGAVLAGQERENGQGYQFVTWIWDYDHIGVSHGHYYEEDFQSAKRDFAVRSGLISNAQLFTPEELTELYRATNYLLEEDPEPEEKQLKTIQTARTRIEYIVPDLQTKLEQGQQESTQQMNL